MKYVFKMTKCDESFKGQVSKVLEKRTELNSRKRYGKIWGIIDRLNSKEKASQKVLEKRCKRYRIYGVLLILLGLFLLLPSLLDPKEMLIPLLVSLFTIFVGILNFRYGRKSKKIKETSFDKGAVILYKEYEKLPAGEGIITFNEDTIQLVGDFTISYKEIETIFITEDLFILIWNERITVLQKKDLSSSNLEDFIDLIKEKSQDKFEIVNMVDI